MFNKLKFNLLKYKCLDFYMKVINKIVFIPLNDLLYSYNEIELKELNADILSYIFFMYYYQMIIN